MMFQRVVNCEVCPKFYKQNPEENPAVVWCDMVWPLFGGNVEMMNWKLGGLKHLKNPT